MPIDYSADKLAIKDWSISDRPREKYLAKGFHTLSDAELIAILIRTGSSDESAVDLGIRLLAMNKNDLNRLAEMSTKELMAINGIGKVKAITIKAAFELGQRRRAEIVSIKKKIKSATDVSELMQDKIAHLEHEEFWSIFLNQSNSILGVDNFSKGGITSTTVDIRLIIKKAIEYNATGLLLCHNHPSGKVNPSEQDLNLTRQLVNAAKMFNIRVLDHIILHKDLFYSFNSEGINLN